MLQTEEWKLNDGGWNEILRWNSPFRSYFEDGNKRHQTRRDRIFTVHHEVKLGRSTTIISALHLPIVFVLVRGISTALFKLERSFDRLPVREYTHPQGWPGCSPLSTWIPYKSRERGRRVCARVRCNHITYDGRRVADGTEENREKKNDEWTGGEETGETRWDREVEKLHWLVGGTVKRCSCPGGIWTPARLSLSFSPSPLLILSLALPLPLLPLFASLTLPPSFLCSLPSLRFYPTAKRRRVTWTQKRSIRASPTRPRSLSYSPLFYPSFTSFLLGTQSLVNLWYRVVHLRVFRTKTSESEKKSVIVVRCWC